VLVNPIAYDRQALKEPQRQALIAFWTAWIEQLTTVRVLNPACGSGAFLVEAFDHCRTATRRRLASPLTRRPAGRIRSG
jgi:hypothetical protein